MRQPHYPAIAAPLRPPARCPTAAMTPDYSLYLVTDSSLLPPSTTLASQITSAIRGGVSIIQLREKTLNTRDFIALGREIHAITRAYNIPLLINDRLDVALVVGCEGLHIGWDDCGANYPWKEVYRAVLMCKCRRGNRAPPSRT